MSSTSIESQLDADDFAIIREDNNPRAIFDATPYIAPKATIDGNLADEIAVKFGGGWEPPVDFFDNLKLGQTVTLTVEVEVVGKSATLKTSGDDTAVVGTASVKVIDVYAKTPEEL